MNGSEISAYRKAHKLTQRQLAKMLGLQTAQQIARWEKGQQHISGAARTLMIVLINEDKADMPTLTDQLIDIASENFRAEMKKALTPI